MRRKIIEIQLENEGKLIRKREIFRECFEYFDHLVTRNENYGKYCEFVDLKDSPS